LGEWAALTFFTVVSGTGRTPCRNTSLQRPASPPVPICRSPPSMLAVIGRRHHYQEENRTR
jgi:hypothetical protein